MKRNGKSMEGPGQRHGVRDFFIFRRMFEEDFHRKHNTLRKQRVAQPRGIGPIDKTAFVVPVLLDGLQTN